jgi:hypothetical protein
VLKFPSTEANSFPIFTRPEADAVVGSLPFQRILDDLLARSLPRAAAEIIIATTWPLAW